MKNLNFIQRLTGRLGILYEAAAFNFYGLILLLIVFLFYWSFPQAKDLLLTLNQEGPFQITLFFVTLITIASVNWYLPRYLYPENNEKLKTWRSFFQEDMDEHVTKEKITHTSTHTKVYKKRMIEMVPRLVGAFILMIVGLGILNIGNEMDSLHFPWGIPASYVLLSLFLFTATLLLVGRTETPWMFLFSDWLLKGIGKWIYGFLVVVAGLLGIALFLNKGDFNSLQFLMYSTVLVSFSFLFITMARKQIPWIKNDKWVIRVIVIFAILQSLFFVIINFITSWSQYLNPLICANLAFIFYLSLFYTLRIIGVSKKVYFVFFFLLLLFITANMTTSATHHEISYSEGAEASFDPDKRKDVYQYFQHWINQRAPQIEQYLAERRAEDSTKIVRYPIVIVSSQGGGSRAAYWTNITHHYLDSQIPGYYDQHLFAMTGASGGNTGNSTYFSMKQAGVPQTEIPAYAREMFMGNFLSSSLTLFLGSDFLQSTLGINVKDDRAKQLEYEWTQKLATATKQKVMTFSDPFLSFWYENGTTQLINKSMDKKVPPILIINTTQVQTGGPAVVSPVTFFSEYYNALDLLHAVDTMSKGTKTIPLSTATLLNASFPYINPAGHVKNVGDFVDAGYYDNYGAQSGIGLFRHLRRLRNNAKNAERDNVHLNAEKPEIENAHLYKNLQFISVLIRNGTVDPPPPFDPASSQLLAPASTIGNIRSGINQHNLWELEQVADQFYKIDLPQRDEIKLYTAEKKDSLSPIIPLARYLSPSALDAMDEGLKVLMRRPESDLNKLVKVLK